MKRLLAATILMTACLFPYPSISPPSLASVPTSYCDLEAVRETEVGTITLTNIYVSETSSSVLEICVDTHEARLTISGQGKMTLLRRNPAFEIDYYNSGSKKDKIKRIGGTSFDYYTSGPRADKLKRIGAISFDYYTSRSRNGKLKQVGNLLFDYYTSGFRAGKLKRIGGADFDYDREGRMETSRTSYNVNIAIVDFVDNR